MAVTLLPGPCRLPGPRPGSRRRGRRLDATITPMDDVSRFYSGPGGLVVAISAALDAAGMDRAALRPAELAPVDEFHIRGRAASVEIIDALSLTADSHVLDLGSGLGGPARTLVELHRVHRHRRRSHAGVLRGRDRALGVDGPVRPNGLPGRRRHRHRTPRPVGGCGDDRARGHEHRGQACAVRRGVPRAAPGRQVRRL